MLPSAARGAESGTVGRGSPTTSATDRVIREPRRGHYALQSRPNELRAAARVDERPRDANQPRWRPPETRRRPFPLSQRLPVATPAVNRNQNLSPFAGPLGEGTSQIRASRNKCDATAAGHADESAAHGEGMIPNPWSNSDAKPQIEEARAQGPQPSPRPGKADEGSGGSCPTSPPSGPPR